MATHDDAGHVIYLRSLTKSVSPAIRVAAVITRGPARDRIMADRGVESMYVSTLLQAAALDVVTQPGWHSHLRTLRQQLHDRRDHLMSALREHAPEATPAHVPAGGLNLWVRLPDGTDVDGLGRTARPPRVASRPYSAGRLMHHRQDRAQRGSVRLRAHATRQGMLGT